MAKAREGESTRGGGFGVSPEKIFEFLALLCAFLMGVLCVWDQISVILVTIFCFKRLLSREKPNAEQNCSTDRHDFFYFIFYSMFL